MPWERIFASVINDFLTQTKDHPSYQPEEKKEPTEKGFSNTFLSVSWCKFSGFFIMYLLPHLPPVCEDNAESEDCDHKYSANTARDQK